MNPDIINNIQINAMHTYYRMCWHQTHTIPFLIIFSIIISVIIFYLYKKYNWDGMALMIPFVAAVSTIISTGIILSYKDNSQFAMKYPQIVYQNVQNFENQQMSDSEFRHS